MAWSRITVGKVCRLLLPFFSPPVLHLALSAFSESSQRTFQTESAVKASPSPLLKFNLEVILFEFVHKLAALWPTGSASCCTWNRRAWMVPAMVFHCLLLLLSCMAEVSIDRSLSFQCFLINCWNNLIEVPAVFKEAPFVTVVSGIFVRLLNLKCQVCSAVTQWQSDSHMTFQFSAWNRLTCYFWICSARSTVIIFERKTLYWGIY